MINGTVCVLVGFMFGLVQFLNKYQTSKICANIAQSLLHLKSIRLE